MPISDVSLANLKKVYEQFGSPSTHGGAAIRDHYGKPQTRSWLSSIALAFGEREIKLLSTAPCEDANGVVPVRIGAVGVGGDRLVVAFLDVSDPGTPVPRVVARSLSEVVATDLRIEDDFGARSSSFEDEDAGNPTYIPANARLEIMFRDGETLVLQGSHKPKLVIAILALADAVPR